MMKIRPSLKMYFFISMILTGVITVIAMSIVSVNFYFAGIDFSKSNAMAVNAYKEQIESGKANKINDFIVTTRWQDLPKEIKTHFNQTELVENELLKHIVGIPLFGPPEEGYFVMMIKRNGETRYISSMFNSKFDLVQKPIANTSFLYIFIIALVAIGLLSLVPFFILRYVATPIEKLIVWAKHLDSEELSQPTPHFHYYELDSLALIIQSSLRSVQESLEREMRFLGYASHELRTPIAVTRTNTELLQKMIQKGVTSEKQLIVLDRIERASLTMTDLTETLLWLNRQQGKPLSIKTVKIGELSQQLASDLNYLLTGKEVEVMIKADDTELDLPEALCRIIITNLIRNAFQHTFDGIVLIEQSTHHLCITNENKVDNSAQEDLGFGLGLELTERLVKHQRWKYKNNKTANGYYVSVEFNDVSLKPKSGR